MLQPEIFVAPGFVARVVHVRERIAGRLHRGVKVDCVRIFLVALAVEDGRQVGAPAEPGFRRDDHPRVQVRGGDMRVARMDDHRHTRGPEARIVLGARNSFDGIPGLLSGHGAVGRPVRSGSVELPPQKFLDFVRHFIRPMRGLIAWTLAISLIASVIELSMFGFLGSLVDRMAASGDERFVPDNLWLLAFMGFVLLVLRPLSTILSRGLVNLSLAPNLSTLVRWESYRYVLRQSLGFFQNDYAGRISQKVMQTGMALRDSVVNVVDGVWYLAVYIAGTLYLLAGFDWRLLLPLIGWTIAYGVVIVALVPPVRLRAVALSEANSGLTGRVVDGFTNILSVKLFAHAEREEAFGHEAFERQLSAARALNRAIVTMTAALTIVNSLFIFAVAGLSIWLWTQGAVTLGAIAAANALALRLNQMSGWILRSITSLFESVGTIENGIATIARPNEMRDRPGAAPFVGGRRRHCVPRRAFPLRRGRAGDRRPVALHPARREGRAGRPVRRGQVDARQPAPAFLRARGREHPVDGQDISAVTQEVAPRARSAWSRRTPRCCIARCATTSAMGGPRRTKRLSSGPRAGRGPIPSSRSSSIRAGGAPTTPMSASVASNSRAGSASVSPLRGSSSRTRRSSSSTRRRARSIRRSRRRSRRSSMSSWPARRWSPSRTACRPSRRWIGSSFSTRPDRRDRPARRAAAQGRALCRSVAAAVGGFLDLGGLQEAGE